MKHRQDGEGQHAVQTGADASIDHLAQLHLQHRRHAAHGVERVVHAVDRAAGRRRGHGGEQRGGGDAEAGFLAFHVAAGREAERLSAPACAAIGLACCSK